MAQLINRLTPFRATILHASVLERDEEIVYQRIKEGLKYKEIGERKTFQQIDSHMKVINSVWVRYDRPDDPEFFGDHTQFMAWFNEKLDEAWPREEEINGNRGTQQQGH